MTYVRVTSPIWELRPSIHFVKREQWERWLQGNRKLVSGSKQRERLVGGCPSLCEGQGVSPWENLRLYMQNPAIMCILAGHLFAMPSTMRYRTF